jgi:hypothetical protein
MGEKRRLPRGTKGVFIVVGKYIKTIKKLILLTSKTTLNQK